MLMPQKSLNAPCVCTEIERLQPQYAFDLEQKLAIWAIILTDGSNPVRFFGKDYRNRQEKSIYKPF